MSVEANQDSEASRDPEPDEGEQRAAASPAPPRRPAGTLPPDSEVDRAIEDFIARANATLVALEDWRLSDEPAARARAEADRREAELRQVAAQAAEGARAEAAREFERREAEREAAVQAAEAARREVERREAERQGAVRAAEAARAEAERREAELHQVAARAAEAAEAAREAERQRLELERQSAEVVAVLEARLAEAERRARAAEERVRERVTRVQPIRRDRSREVTVRTGPPIMGRETEPFPRVAAPSPARSARLAKIDLRARGAITERVRETRPPEAAPTQAAPLEVTSPGTIVVDPTVAESSAPGPADDLVALAASVIDPATIEAAAIEPATWEPDVLDAGSIPDQAIADAAITHAPRADAQPPEVPIAIVDAPFAAGTGPLGPNHLTPVRRRPGPHPVRHPEPPPVATSAPEPEPEPAAEPAFEAEVTSEPTIPRAVRAETSVAETLPEAPARRRRRSAKAPARRYNWKPLVDENPEASAGASPSPGDAATGDARAPSAQRRLRGLLSRLPILGGGARLLGERPPARPREVGDGEAGADDPASANAVAAADPAASASAAAAADPAASASAVAAADDAASACAAATADDAASAGAAATAAASSASAAPSPPRRRGSGARKPPPRYRWKPLVDENAGGEASAPAAASATTSASATTTASGMPSSAASDTSSATPAASVTPMPTPATSAAHAATPTAPLTAAPTATANRPGASAAMSSTPTVPDDRAASAEPAAPGRRGFPSRKAPARKYRWKPLVDESPADTGTVEAGAAASAPASFASPPAPAPAPSAPVAAASAPPAAELPESVDLDASNRAGLAAASRPATLDLYPARPTHVATGHEAATLSSSPTAGRDVVRHAPTLDLHRTRPAELAASDPAATLDLTPRRPLPDARVDPVAKDAALAAVARDAALAPVTPASVSAARSRRDAPRQRPPRTYRWKPLVDERAGDEGSSEAAAQTMTVAAPSARRAAVLNPSLVQTQTDRIPALGRRSIAPIAVSAGVALAGVLIAVLVLVGRDRTDEKAAPPSPTAAAAMTESSRTAPARALSLPTSGPSQDAGRAQPQPVVRSLLPAEMTVIPLADDDESPAREPGARPRKDPAPPASAPPPR